MSRVREPYDYDEQVERLTKYPYQIKNDWLRGRGLFQFASTTKRSLIESGCGDLMDIRNETLGYCSEKVISGAYINGVRDEELTAKIRNDERLPKFFNDVKPEHFPIFKEYQMLIDNLAHK